jgi:hypothetical protein
MQVADFRRRRTSDRIASAIGSPSHGEKGVRVLKGAPDLRYDGVLWNNNNAEHAIKSFAKLRDIVAGSSTKKGIEEYLTLLSVSESCKYRGIDFLDFLRSGKMDIVTFAQAEVKVE